MTRYSVVLITAPTGAPAKKISDKLLKGRLAACVNIIPVVQSSYWWKGKITKDKEALLIVKTRTGLMKKLQAVVRSVHPYAVPEIISLPILAGHKPYLRWIHDETK